MKERKNKLINIFHPRRRKQRLLTDICPEEGLAKVILIIRLLAKFLLNLAVRFYFTIIIYNSIFYYIDYDKESTNFEL